MMKRLLLAAVVAGAAVAPASGRAFTCTPDPLPVQVCEDHTIGAGFATICVTESSPVSIGFSCAGITQAKPRTDAGGCSSDQVDDVGGHRVCAGGATDGQTFVSGGVGLHADYPVIGCKDISVRAGVPGSPIYSVTPC